MLTIETKQEMIAKLESGQKMCDVAWQYGSNRSTVDTIFTKKGITKKTQAAEAVIKITYEKQRYGIHETMELSLIHI